MYPNEERPALDRAQPGERIGNNFLGAALRRLQVVDQRIFQRPAKRAGIRLKALAQPSALVQEIGAHECAGCIVLRTEQLRQRGRTTGKPIAHVVADAMNRRRSPCQNRAVRRKGERRRDDYSAESHAVAREIVERSRARLLVAITAHPVGSQRIDGDSSGLCFRQQPNTAKSTDRATM